MRRFAVILPALLQVAVVAQGEAAMVAVREPAEAIAASRLLDVDGDGSAELVLVDAGGAVLTWRMVEDELRQTLVTRLPRPRSSLLAFADVLDDQGLELVVLDDRGMAAISTRGDGGGDAEPTWLTRAGRMRLQVGQPRFSPFLQDLNRDGRLDVLVPFEDGVEFWRGTSDAGEARFELGQRVPAPVEREQVVHARHAGVALENRVEVPGLDVEDLNGDGRPDLRTEEGMVRRFFLQGDDGTFATEPIEVDLERFRDTTPKAEIELGSTLVPSDFQQMARGDLNADGVPDYVITHRRKVWTFLSSEAGPQFDRARVRVVAEDVSAVALLHLDDDDRKDLLIIKLDVPSAAQLALGLVRSIDISIRVVGYATGPDGAFADRATWRRDLTLRVPSIVRILAEANDLAERFRDMLTRLRWSATGDFDGDGGDDLALLTEDEAAVELWFGERAAPEDAERRMARWITRLLFEDEDTVFDVERLFGLVAQVLDAHNAAITAGRDPELRLTLPPSDGGAVTRFSAADMNGDGRSEGVLFRERDDRPARPRVEVLRLSR